MIARIAALLRARLASREGGGLFPVTTLLSQALIAATMAGLVRDALPPFAYALTMLTVSGALVAIPLLGELGTLLRADPAAIWVSALPVRAREVSVARTAHLLVALLVLASASLLPTAVLAPAEVELVSRVGLLLAGFGVSLVLAAVLVGIQALLGGRAESLLVGIQTLLVVAVVAGLTLGVQQIGRMTSWRDLSDAPDALLAYPVALFAGAFSESGPPAGTASLAALSLTLGALLVLVLTPSPAPQAHRAGIGALERLLLPARRLAERSWVRTDERAAFDLVYDALPREREVVLRTVPMIGIPLAFLLADTFSESGARETRGLLALLLFTPGIYLPVLLTQVPISESWRASWILRTSPVSAGAVAAGSAKALATRYLLPLYTVLFAIAWARGSLEMATALAIPGGLVSLIVLLSMYPKCVPSAPLSAPPDETHVEFDWGGMLFGLAMALTVAAVLAAQFLHGILPSLGVGAVLALLAFASGVRLRAGVAD